MVQDALSWHVGDVKITRIVEVEIADVPPEFVLEGLTSDRVREISWLEPNFATSEGLLTIAFQAFVIESENKTIIVDTCVGNDKKRSLEHWNDLHTPFLADLIAAGFDPGSIDIVLCTHLHIDHVGWNTKLANDRWVPTFPNARYLFGRLEWEFWHEQVTSAVPVDEGDMMDTEAVFADSLQPIVDAGLHQLVETNHRVTNEVELIPTPGHTPGHVSVVIRSNGAEAVITGDAIHHPIQMSVPSLRSHFDNDGAVACTTRCNFLRKYENSETLVLGTHFGAPTAGYIVKHGNYWRLDVSSKPVPLSG